ncbi:MAG: transglycosylase SLT domain-containing protein [Candidatus Baltobacteraceae bacterium]
MNPLSGIRYAAQIAAAAESHGIDPRLLAAVAAQETGGPGSSSGANIVGDGGHGHGLFQIDDRYHAFAGTPQAMDPAQNANYAAGLLSGLISRYKGDVKAALSAYNSGSPAAAGTITTWGDGSRLGYADSVLRHEAMLEGGSGSLAAENPETVSGVNALSDYAAASGAAPAPALPGASSSAQAASTQASSACAAQAPAPQVPQWTAPQWQFLSFQSELQAGGGAMAARDDAAMASLVDPMSGDGSDRDG